MTRRARGWKGGAPAAASGAEVPAADTSGSVAGYRVLRRIGSGSRSDVYLGASDQVAADGQREVVVLKVFHGGETPSAVIDRAVIEREVRALGAVPGGGVGRLLDVATLPDGRVCLVLAEDRGGSLGLLLAGRRMLGPGEAVTILAPVLATLARLFDGGLVHPEIDPGVIRFDGTGRPVVGGLGRLRDLPPPGRARDAVLIEARAGFGEVLRAVLERVSETEDLPAARNGLVAAWQAGSYREALAELERALFDWSPAAPVRLGGQEVTSGATVTRGASRTGSTDPRGRHRTPGPLASLEAALDQRPGPLVRAWVVQLGERTIRRARSARRDDRRGSWRAPEDPNRWRRRGLILSGAVGLVLLLVAAWSVLAPVAARSGTIVSLNSPVSPALPEDGGGAASESTAPPTAGLTGADQNVLLGEDPAAATVVLLRMRAGCFAATNQECLREISQPDSPALAEDSALFGLATGTAATGTTATGTMTEGAELVVDGSGPIVVNRIGNLAMVALSGFGQGAQSGNDKPASALVVKGEAGWRLREYFGAG